MNKKRRHMKKPLIITAIVIVILALGGGAYYFLVINKGSLSSELTNAQEQGQPTRSAEVKGLVQSIEGNELVIANELNTDELTDEEKEAKKTERQSMSQEERQALKADETAQAETKNVSITIPVGVKMMKSTGDVSGELVAAELADIKVGTYVSIWVKDYLTDKAEFEFVKVRPTES